MEEIQAELEAMIAVYGDDCRILREFPPHVDVYMKPRTADDLAQQFVEVVLGLRANAQYPDVSPEILIVDSKGLDADRCEKLTAIVRRKAMDLSYNPMLIALCEEAVDILTDMNHPEGNCPLCLDPLFYQDSNQQSIPFMKLMSCFHCFHNKCILRWWEWVQGEAEKNADNPPCDSLKKAKCPVCRKVFDSRDLEHISSLTESNMPEPVAGSDWPEWDILHSDTENQRREQFEAIIQIQREKDGLIEPKKELIVTPGMFISLPPVAPPLPSASTDKVIKKPTGRLERENGISSRRKKYVKKERGSH